MSDESIRSDAGRREPIKAPGARLQSAARYARLQSAARCEGGATAAISPGARTQAVSSAVEGAYVVRVREFRAVNTGPDAGVAGRPCAEAMSAAYAAGGTAAAPGVES